MVLESINDPNTAKTLVLPEKTNRDSFSFNPNEIYNSIIDRESNKITENLIKMMTVLKVHPASFDYQEDLSEFEWRFFRRASILKILRPDINPAEYGINDERWNLLKKLTLNSSIFKQSHETKLVRIYLAYLRDCRVLYPNRFSEVEPTRDQWHSIQMEVNNEDPDFQYALLSDLVVANPQLRQSDLNPFKDRESDVKKFWNRVISGDNHNRTIGFGADINIISPKMFSQLDLTEDFQQHCRKYWKENLTYKTAWDFTELANLCFISANSIKINDQGVFLEYNKPQEQNPPVLPKVQSFK